MKFKFDRDFKRGRTVFEAGNTYDAEKQGVTEADLKRWHGAGLCDVEGWPPKPPRKIQGQTVQPKDTVQGQQSKES